MYKRYFENDDYLMLREWWDAWKWVPIPKEFLPPTGIVIGDDDGDICAVFIYRTDTPIAWVENYISNPNAKGVRRKEAMRRLIIEAEKEAKSLGFSVIMSAVKHDNLALKLIQGGFIKADSGLTNYIKGI